MHLNNLKDISWNNRIKAIIAVIITLFLCRMAYLIDNANYYINISNEIFDQHKDDDKKLEEQISKDVQSVQDGLLDGADQLSRGMDRVGNRIDKFEKEFNSSLAAMIKNHNEGIRKHDIYEFLNQEYGIKDKQIYEKDRILYQRTTSTEMPTYEQFLQLKEKLLLCFAKNHNRELERQYKNKLSILKTKINKNLSAIEKPKYWQIPLSKENIAEMNSSLFNKDFRFFVRLDGTCKDE